MTNLTDIDDAEVEDARSQAYRRGYLDGYHNRPNQAQIAGDDPRDMFPRRDYASGYVAGVIEADLDHERGVS